MESDHDVDCERVGTGFLFKGDLLVLVAVEVMMVASSRRNGGVELLMTVTLCARAGLPRSRCKTWLRCSQDCGQPEDWGGELSLPRDNH